MSRSIRTLITAAAGIAALLAAGCTSIPLQDGAMSGKMAGDHECMMMAKHAAAGEQAKPMACKMDCNCPMMQKHGAADTPSAPSLAPEEHQHTPDAPAAGH